jgi:stage II sporulation protein P
MTDKKKLTFRKSPALDGGERKNIRGEASANCWKRNHDLSGFYKLYIVTTLCAILGVTVLLLFGVSANGTPLAGNLSLVRIADKIGNLVLKADFADVSNGRDFDVDGGQIFLDTDKHPNNNTTTDTPSVESGAQLKDIYDFDYSVVPESSTAIVPMDLSLIKYGSGYINNSTGYEPDTLKLLNKNLRGSSDEVLAIRDEPLVLIIHTHGTEAFSADGAKYFSEDESNYARSEDTRKNVVSVGETVADILNDKGVPTIHCTVMHDSLQYKDSYARAEETIKKYLAEYPSIKLVIDIHRDSIIRSNGDMIRPVAVHNGEAMAQLMCVVGSDWGGQECDGWENNLSLALKLREKLNSECENICRPTNLKPSTYNQEIADYSLLIEVGSSGNSLAEAQRSARLLALKICELMNEI